MPQLLINTQSDAEVFVMNAALNRIARSVGVFSGELDPGLYKIKVQRAGAVRETLIELAREDKKLDLPIDFFPSIAPLAKMLTDQDAASVEVVARYPLAEAPAQSILILAQQPTAGADESKPFGGARLFPWGATRQSVSLDGRPRRSVTVGDTFWTAITVPAEAVKSPYVLELRHGTRNSRQCVAVIEGWQTRIYLRAHLLSSVSQQSGTATPACGPFDVSVQMARYGDPVVLNELTETAEVARTALASGRAIYGRDKLLDALFYAKYDNPMSGIAGLHLFLDAKERWESQERKKAEERTRAKSRGDAEASWDAGHASYDLKKATEDLLQTDPQGVADEVLKNLTRLLYPRRADAAAGDFTAVDLLYPDAKWPESADLTALRLRAGRVTTQVVITAAPMFHASWTVLKAHAARDGLTWIGRKLWTSTGDAVALGAYLAWPPRRHSVKRTLQDIDGQRIDIGRGSVADQNAIGTVKWVRDNKGFFKDDKIFGFLTQDAGTDAELMQVALAATEPPEHRAQTLNIEVGLSAPWIDIGRVGMADQRVMGKVKWFKDDKGFDLITKGGVPDEELTQLAVATTAPQAQMFNMEAGLFADFNSQRAMATAFGLPLSILQRAPRKPPRP